MPSLARFARLLLAGGVLAGAAALAAPALQEVTIATPSGEGLRGLWLPAVGAGARPVVLALHGCGGLHDTQGRLSARYREAAQRLHAEGYGVLLLDSFSARGLREICRTRYRERSLTVAARAQDARAALAWLAAQPEVDRRRIGVLGWSNGATTALNLLEQRAGHPAAGEPPVAGVALFYPGCGPLQRRRAALESVPLLMQLGALDDWTPPAPCVELAHRLQGLPGGDVTLRVYEGSYHGFDGTAPVRVRPDVPNGSTGAGVHVGGNPEARAQALTVLSVFWRRAFGVAG